MNTPKRWIALMVAMILLMTLLGGCAKTNNSNLQPTQTAGAGTDNLTHVRFILDYVPNTNHIGVYVAQALGYYKEEGLDVEIIQPTEGATATLIASGKGEFGVSYQEDVTYARTADDPLPVKAIAAILQHNTSGFVSVKEKNITSPKDFENKKYTGWGSPAEEAIIKAVMERAGADPSKISIVQSTGADTISVIQNQVDLTWIYYGWTGIELELANVAVKLSAFDRFAPGAGFLYAGYYCFGVVSVTKPGHCAEVLKSDVKRLSILRGSSRRSVEIVRCGCSGLFAGDDSAQRGIS